MAVAFVLDAVATASASEIISGLRESFVTLSDSGSAVDSFVANRSITVLLSENLQATDAVVVNQVLNVALEDNVTAHVFLALGGVTYDGWTLNTESLGVTEYTNVRGNAPFKFQDRYYTTSSDGVYEFVGDTDAGDNIDMVVRTGLDTLGTAYMKRIPNVYIGYTTSGRAVLKVVSTDNGVKRENWYNLRAVQKTSTSDNRFDVAKGHKSVYWQFEIANELGADLELETVKAWRLVLNRRK
jgi:hypothetical protein